MNCERNICYQQEYNGGCDTCPCNRTTEESSEVKITTQEAMETLKFLLSIERHHKEPLRMAIEALEKQLASEWIPVSERLPEELIAVNVTWINRCPENYYTNIKDKPFTDTAILYQGEWYWWDSTIIDYLSECGTCVSGVVNKSIDILAWMPLPEPMRLEKRDD